MSSTALRAACKLHNGMFLTAYKRLLTNLAGFSRINDRALLIESTGYTSKEKMFYGYARHFLQSHLPYTYVAAQTDIDTVKRWLEDRYAK